MKFNERIHPTRHRQLQADEEGTNSHAHRDEYRARGKFFARMDANVISRFDRLRLTGGFAREETCSRSRIMPDQLVIFE